MGATEMTNQRWRIGQQDCLDSLNRHHATNWPAISVKRCDAASGNESFKYARRKKHKLRGKDCAERMTTEVRYEQREVLGFKDANLDLIKNGLLRHLMQTSFTNV